MTHNEDIAHEILSAALDQDLKNFPNAKLGLKQPLKADKPPTSRERLGTAIAELEACVSECQALIEALKMLQARL